MNKYILKANPPFSKRLSNLFLKINIFIFIFLNKEYYFLTTKLRCAHKSLNTHIGKIRLDLLIFRLPLFIFLCSGPILSDPSFSYEFLEQQKVNAHKKKSQKIQMQKAVRAWTNQNHSFQYIPYPFSLTAKNKNINKALFERAKNAIEECRIQIRASKQKSNLLTIHSRSIQEGIWWKQVDKKDQIKRRLQKVKKKKQLQLVSLSRMGIKALDKIDDFDITKSTAGKQRYRELFRILASNQIAIGQFKNALLVLKRLRRINDLSPDWVMHYYFSLCYQYMLRVSIANTSVTDVKLRALRKKKNLHLQLSAESRFGKKSVEAITTRARIKRDELGPPRLNAQ